MYFVFRGSDSSPDWVAGNARDRIELTSGGVTLVASNPIGNQSFQDARSQAGAWERGIFRNIRSGNLLQLDEAIANHTTLSGVWFGVGSFEKELQRFLQVVPGVHPGMPSFSDQAFVPDPFFLQELIELHRRFKKEIFLSDSQPEQFQLCVRFVWSGCQGAKVCAENFGCQVRTIGTDPGELVEVRKASEQRLTAAA